jgi:hypothetical protein
MSLSGYAQTEIEKKFKSIPPINKPPKPKKVIPPKVDLPKMEPYVPVALPKNNFVVPKNEVIDPEKASKRNQDLGVFKTNSFTARVRYRDAAYVDGDRIKVFLNYVIIEQEVLLDGDFKGFEIKLKKGVNRIDFEALNAGIAPPNTAEFQIYDDKGNIISASQWNIGQGYKATIILEKD